jgi:hypothetical protein
MLKKLAVVAVSGLVVCAICLGAAAAIGGKALHESGFDFGSFGDSPRCAFAPSDAQGSRSLAWSGGDSVAIAIPAKVHYRRGTGDQVVLSGDSAVLPHIYITNSTIKLDCRWHDDEDGIDVTLPGRLFKGFKIAGAGKLTLDDIDQPDLNISIAGAGNVEANGKADNLDLHMAGAGNARLGALAVSNANVHMAGANNAEISPRDDVKVHIAGFGNVRLLTEPHTIESHIAGAGHVTHPHDLDNAP